MNENETSSRILGMRRFSAVELLIALALLFFFFPFVEEVKGGDLIVSILLSLVLLSAVFTVASRRTLIVALLLAIPAVAGRWLNHCQPHLVSPPIFLVAGLLLVAFVVVNLLRFILHAPSVNLEVLCASVSAYLMLGLLWTIAYWLVAAISPTAFAFNTTTVAKESMHGFNAFYFSFVTLSTVGYGDITPVSKVARMLAAMEAMTGLLYVAVLIARLVALYSTPKSHDS
jgi:voltage-gated potassium channel